MADLSYPPFNVASIQPPYVAGRWYWADRVAYNSGSVSAANTIRLNSILIKRAITVSDLFVRIATTSAGGNVQVAIYASDPVTQMPTGSALMSTGNLSTASAAVVSGAISGSGVLAPGLYWFANNADNSTVALQGVAATWSIDSALIGSTTLANISSATNTAAITWTVAQTFGTWPSLTSASFTEAGGTQAPGWGFKVSVGG